MARTLKRLDRPWLLAALCAGAWPLAALGQPVGNLESEPNNTIVDASIPNSGGPGLRDTDYITGTSDGNDIDWFRVIIAPHAARGIYRCTLAVSSPNGSPPNSALQVLLPGNSNLTIGGTSIVDGLVGSTFYTFGGQTSVNYRLAAGNGSYRSTLSMTPETVTPVGAPVLAGDLVISMASFPVTPAQPRQIVVYDSRFQAIAGYTNAGTATINNAGNPELHRNFAPGTYSIGVCTGHMFNEYAPPADANAIPWTMPFVDTLICDYPFHGGSRSVGFTIQHAGGQVVVPATVSSAYGVAWYQMTVVSTAANDTCATATPLGVGTPIYGESTAAALVNDGNQTCLGPAIETAGVWYEFEGSGDTLTIGVTPEGNYNPRIHAYCARGGCGALTCVGSSDSNGRGVPEYLSVCTDPGATYKFLVSGSTSGFDTPTGNFAVVVTDDGIACNSAVVCSSRGACSVDGACQILSAGACAQRGGSYCGDNTSCSAEGVYTVTSTPGFDLGELIGGGDGFVTLGDDVSAQLSLPFAFPFYGVPFTSVYVSSNGYVTFDAINTSVYTNTPIPDVAGPNNAIYGLWSDLVTPVLGYQTRGTAPNRRFIMEWNRVSHYQGNDPNNTFQIVLFEDGHVEMRYADLNTPLARLATIGIENGTGTAATSFPAAQFDGFYRTVSFGYEPGVPSCHPRCAPDFNGDGDLNPDDLGDYITCYFAQPPCDGADYNADTNIDPDDLGDYITAYFQGC